MKETEQLMAQHSVPSSISDNDGVSQLCCSNTMEANIANNPTLQRGPIMEDYFSDKDLKEVKSMQPRAISNDHSDGSTSGLRSCSSDDDSAYEINKVLSITKPSCSSNVSSKELLELNQSEEPTWALGTVSNAYESITIPFDGVEKRTSSNESIDPGADIRLTEPFADKLKNFTETNGLELSSSGHCTTDESEEHSVSETRDNESNVLEGGNNLPQGASPSSLKSSPDDDATMEVETSSHPSLSENTELHLIASLSEAPLQKSKDDSKCPNELIKCVKCLALPSEISIDQSSQSNGLAIQNFHSTANEKNTKHQNPKEILPAIYETIQSSSEKNVVNSEAVNSCNESSPLSSPAQVDDSDSELVCHIDEYLTGVLKTSDRDERGTCSSSISYSEFAPADVTQSLIVENTTSIDMTDDCLPEECIDILDFSPPLNDINPISPRSYASNEDNDSIEEGAETIGFCQILKKKTIEYITVKLFDELDNYHLTGENSLKDDSIPTADNIFLSDVLNILDGEYSEKTINEISHSDTLTNSTGSTIVEGGGDFSDAHFTEPEVKDEIDNLEKSNDVTSTTSTECTSRNHRDASVRRSKRKSPQKKKLEKISGKEDSISMNKKERLKNKKKSIKNDSEETEPADLFNANKIEEQTECLTKKKRGRPRKKVLKQQIITGIYDIRSSPSISSLQKSDENDCLEETGKFDLTEEYKILKDDLHNLQNLLNLSTQSDESDLSSLELNLEDSDECFNVSYSSTPVKSSIKPTIICDDRVLNSPSGFKSDDSDATDDGLSPTVGVEK